MLLRMLMVLVLVRSPVVGAAKVPSRSPIHSAIALNGTHFQAIRSAHDVLPVMKLSTSTCMEALLINSAISAAHAATLSPYHAVLRRLRGGAWERLPRMVRCIPPALLTFVWLWAIPSMKSDVAKCAWSMVGGAMIYTLCSLLRVSGELDLLVSVFTGG